MKVKRGKRLFLAAFFLVIGGLLLTSGQVIAQTTQGEVALQLSGFLGFDTSSVDNAVNDLIAADIIPSGGWNASEAASDVFVCSLFRTVNTAASAGRLTAPAALQSPSALVAASCTAAGMPSRPIVNALLLCGGNEEAALSGASYGATVAATKVPGPPAGDRRPVVLMPVTSGPVGGGGGGTGTPSR